MMLHVLPLISIRGGERHVTCHKWDSQFCRFSFHSCATLGMFYNSINNCLLHISIM
jgi:hypothetical protein